MLQINQELINLIKGFEGLRLVAYDDKNPNKVLKPNDKILGTLTIGYGHTKGVFIGQVITESQAEKMLIEDLESYINTVLNVVKVPLNINMFNALVSLCYNIGQGAFKGSTLVKYLNNNDYVNASEQIKVWHSYNTLHARRYKEFELFNQDKFVLEMIIPAIEITKKKANYILPIVAIILLFLIPKFLR